MYMNKTAAASTTGTTATDFPPIDQQSTWLHVSTAATSTAAATATLLWDWESFQCECATGPH
jgi:hypothetical protein